MPAHFGPRPFSTKASGWYRDVTSMVVSFVTDREQLGRYLPSPFRVAEEAVVTITYACNRQVDWLAGNGYNLVAVSAAADFIGEQETLSGDYALVMWENLTDPILTGRELQGIPKVYADIQDHTVLHGDWHTSASHFGHKFLDLDVSNLRDPSEDEIAADAAARLGRDNPMAWRLYPGVGGFGESINEYTTFPSENRITDAWVGEGEARWQHLSWEQNPTQFHIINALADLPVLEWRPAVVVKGSTNLVVAERLPRVIN
ncbi:acetoacetate decarboxylase [Pseudohalioglobus sediminis]|uniref:Acetoacetate decarboxylase n=2 Tax=Pseudohalioglobus sediminis TaxID=2606449 RepID=A0A5B0X8Y8_9GAMM|nr:acetoacetate decarboxylase [Pseudohalioglobus sediminis]